jgi:hypothetical protein
MSDIDDEIWALIGKMAVAVGAGYVVYQIGKEASRAGVTGKKAELGILIVKGIAKAMDDPKYDAPVSSPVIRKKKNWWQWRPKVKKLNALGRRGWRG